MVGGLTSAGSPSVKLSSNPLRDSDQVRRIDISSIATQENGVTTLSLKGIKLTDENINSFIEALTQYQQQHPGKYRVTLGDIKCKDLRFFAVKILPIFVDLVSIIMNLDPSSCVHKTDRQTLQKQFHQNTTIEEFHDTRADMYMGQGADYLSDLKRILKGENEWLRLIAYARGCALRNKMRSSSGRWELEQNFLTDYTKILELSSSAPSTGPVTEIIVTKAPCDRRLEDELKSKYERVHATSSLHTKSLPHQALMGVVLSPSHPIGNKLFTHVQTTEKGASLFTRAIAGGLDLNEDTGIKSVGGTVDPKNVIRVRQSMEQEFRLHKHYRVLSALASNVASLTHVRKLSLNGIDLQDPDERKALLRILYEPSIPLTSLSLVDCNLNDTACAEVVEAIMDRAAENKRESLESLDLSGNVIQKADQSGLSVLLRSVKELKQVTLSDNSLAPSEVEILQRQIKENESHPDIKLIGVDLPSADKGSDPSEGRKDVRRKKVDNEARKGQLASQVTLPLDASQLEKDLYAQNYLWTVDEAIERAGSVESCGVVVHTPDDWKRLLKHILPINEIFKKIVFLRFGQNSLPSRIDSKVLEAFRNNESIIEVVGIDAQHSLALIRSYAERNRLRTTEGKSWFIREGEGFDYKSVFEKMPADLEAIEIQFSRQGTSSTEGQEEFTVSSSGIPLKPQSHISERLLLTHVENEDRAVELFGHAMREEIITVAPERFQTHEKYSARERLIGQELEEAQSQHALAYLATHLDKLQNLKILSLNGVKLRAVDLQALVNILSAPSIALSSLFITEGKLGDPECQVLVEAILDGDVSRKREGLTLIDLSDNRLTTVNKSGINLLLRCKKRLRSIGLARNPLLSSVNMLSLRRQFPSIESWYMDKFPNDKPEDVHTQLMPRTLSVKRETIGEHTRRRLGTQFSHLLVVSEEQPAETPPTVEEGDKDLKSKLEEEVRRQLGPLLERMQALEGSLTTGVDSSLSTTSFTDLTEDIDAYMEAAQDEVVLNQVRTEVQQVIQDGMEFRENAGSVARVIVEHAGLADEQKKILEDIEKIKERLRELEQDSSGGELVARELEAQKTKLDEAVGKLNDIANDVYELRRLEEIEIRRGEFLQQQEIFQLVYGHIVTRLKNAMLAQGVIGSGLLNPDSYSTPPSYQKNLKAVGQWVGKLPLSVFRKTGTTGIEVVFGAAGGACSIAAVAASGLSFGGSLALELVPVLLAMLTPVITASTQFGCLVLEKIGDTVTGAVTDKLFNEINNRRARNQAKAMVQVGSLMSHDQLNRDLAFGFVYLWQEQLQFLKPASALKFAESWVNAYLKFITKNAASLTGLARGRGKKGQQLLLDDLLWKEISGDTLETVFQGSHNEMQWPNRQLGFLFQHAHSKHLTSRALIQKTGIRCRLPDGKWKYWSTDPDFEAVLSQYTTGEEQIKEVNRLIDDRRRTRAYLYGYRTFPSLKQAEDFISLHTNHFRGYTAHAIDLTVEAILNLPAHVTKGDKRLSREKGRAYVLSVGQDQAMVTAVAPALERQKERNISECFAEVTTLHIGQQVAYLASRYIAIILAPGANGKLLFTSLNKHLDFLRPQLMDIVQCNTKTTWDVLQRFFAESSRVEELRSLKATDLISRAVVEKILEVFLQGKMDVALIEPMRKELEDSAQHAAESPFQELIQVMTEKEKKEGRLLIPITLTHALDWMIVEVHFTCEKDGYEMAIIYHQIAEQGVATEIGNEIRNQLDQLIGAGKITRCIRDRDPNNLDWVSFSALSEMKKGYTGSISFGIFAAEVLRYLMLGQSTFCRCDTLESVIKIGKEHQRLMRYYKLIGNRYLEGTALEKYQEKYPDLKGLIAEKRDLNWQPDEQPLGPPDPIKRPNNSRLHQARLKAGKAIAELVGRRRGRVDVSRLDFENTMTDIGGRVELLFGIVPGARDAEANKAREVEKKHDKK